MHKTGVYAQNYLPSLKIKYIDVAISLPRYCANQYCWPKTIAVTKLYIKYSRQFFLKNRLFQFYVSQFNDKFDKQFKVADQVNQIEIMKKHWCCAEIKHSYWMLTSFNHLESFILVKSTICLWHWWQSFHNHTYFRPFGKTKKEKGWEFHV